MDARTFPGTGHGVRVAIVDSGVHASHPHVRGVAGGIAIAPDGTEHQDYVDRLGHGTAVAAAIREKVPAAELFVVKIFDRTLSADADVLVKAIAWAARSGMQLVNLSLGTPRADREEVLRVAIDSAADAGVVVVAAGPNEGVRWLPGSLRGVVSVRVDWTCARETYRVVADEGDECVFCASGYPRPIPGVAPELNLKGVSFAVANMTGFVARAIEAYPGARLPELIEVLKGATLVS